MTTLTHDLNMDTTILTEETITASNTILSNANVIYKAGMSINLLPGFQVQNGSSFTAIIEDCTQTASLKEEEQIPQLKFITNLQKDKIAPQLSIFPNPSYHQTNIAYSLPKSASVSIEVYDIMGQTLKTLKSKAIQEAGNYQLTFESENFQSGTYFIVLKNGQAVYTQRLLLIK